MLQRLIYMQPVEVQDVVGQQRCVNSLKNLSSCAVIGITHHLAMEVSLQNGNEFIVSGEEALHLQNNTRRAQG